MPERKHFIKIFPVTSHCKVVPEKWAHLSLDAHQTVWADGTLLHAARGQKQRKCAICWSKHMYKKRYYGRDTSICKIHCLKTNFFLHKHWRDVHSLADPKLTLLWHEQVDTFHNIQEHLCSHFHPTSCSLDHDRVLVYIGSFASAFFSKLAISQCTQPTNYSSGAYFILLVHKPFPSPTHSSCNLQCCIGRCSYILWLHIIKQ